MTIKDLAEKTGYAVATVSRALIGHPNVSEKAREAILQAAEESGFQLNTNAKQLKQQHATSILVVVKGTFNELFSGLVQEIQNFLADTRYPLIVDYMDEDDNEVLRAIQLCREKKPLGILFLGGNQAHFRRDFHRISVPCVLVTNDASGLDFENLSSVYVDDRQAVRCAMEALMDLGHRKIAMIGGDPTVSDISRQRLQGCLDALGSRGLSFDPELDYRAVRFSYADGYRAAASLLASGRQFTALFAASDVMAIGAIRALKDRGLRVPEDVSVMGFDGLELGSYLVPKLATVAQPVRELAQRSIDILTSCIQDGISHHESVPFEVRKLESVQVPGE